MRMPTIDVSLTDALQSFVDQQVADSDFETCSEYIQDLISRERDRQKLRDLIMAGVNSPPAVVADDEFFDQLYRRLDSDENQ